MKTAKKIKVLVTGGAGYVGSHTAAALAEAGYEPVIADNFTNSYRRNIAMLKRTTSQRLKVYKTDCTDQKAMERIFAAEGDIAGVIHFAAFKSVRESVGMPLAYYRNNIASLTATVAAQLKYKVPYMIFSSSCTVYGDPKRSPVRENDAFGKAQSPYGFTKQAGERILEDVCGQSAALKGLALRYFNPIGAHPSGKMGEDSFNPFHNFVPLVLWTILEGGSKVTVLGDDYPTKDGTCVRDYLHVMDVARAHVQGLQYLSSSKRSGAFESFNIGLGRGYSVLQILQEIEAVTGKRVPVRMGPRAKGDIAAIYADVSKAKRVLGFKAAYSIQDAITHAWQWQQQLRTKGRISC